MAAKLVASAALSDTLTNVEPGPAIRGRIPLISWVRAGSFCQTSAQWFAPVDKAEELTWGLLGDPAELAWENY